MESITLKQLCDFLEQQGLSCRIVGNADQEIHAVNTLEDATSGQISFLNNPKYEKMLATTKASIVIVGEQIEAPQHLTLIRTADPYAALCAAIVRVHGYRRHPKWGVSPKAQIAPSAVVGQNANIGANVIIDEDVVIGRDATLYPSCYIARGCRLGDGVTFYPNVTVYDDSIIGHRVTLHAGTVIGEDGLGYAPVGRQWVKIPQVGQVVIADDVEIGANCAIDRATLGKTVIGAGTKFSNLVTIGHGTKIGPNCLLVAQVGIAGSVNVGEHVTMAGQAGVVGHVNIGDNATIGAQAGVTHDVQAGITVLGAPAYPIADTKRQLVAAKRLPEMREQLKELIEKVAKLGEPPR